MWKTSPPTPTLVEAAQYLPTIILVFFASHTRRQAKLKHVSHWVSASGSKGVFYAFVWKLSAKNGPAISEMRLGRHILFCPFHLPLSTEDS